MDIDAICFKPYKRYITFILGRIWIQGLRRLGSTHMSVLQCLFESLYNLSWLDIQYSPGIDTSNIDQGACCAHSATPSADFRITHKREHFERDALTRH